MIEKKTILNFSKLDNNFKKKCEITIKQNNFCIIRNFLSTQKILKSKNKIFKKFFTFKPNTKLNPLNNSYEHRKILEKNKIKKNVIEIFNPDRDRDIYELRKLFNEMTKLRNLLLGLPLKKKFFIYKDKKYFTSNRIMYYRSDEGFLESHFDKKAGNYTKQKFGKYYQILTALTKKGNDFKSGGGVIFKGKKKIFIDDYLNYGDVLIYNEKLKHGVDKIISNNKEKNKGRISVLVTFYKIFT